MAGGDGKRFKGSTHKLLTQIGKFKTIDYVLNLANKINKQEVVAVLPLLSVRVVLFATEPNESSSIWWNFLYHDLLNVQNILLFIYSRYFM